MTVKYGTIESTSAQTVNDSSQSIQVDNSVSGKRFSFLIVSTVPAHIEYTAAETGATEANDATTDSAYIPANTVTQWDATAGSWFAFIRDGGTSGNLYFMTTDRR